MRSAERGLDSPFLLIVRVIVNILLNQMSSLFGTPSGWRGLVMGIWKGFCFRLSDIIFQNPAKGELMVATSTLLWGIWLFHSTQSFDNPAYHMLDQIAPELFWATVLTSLGIIQFSILLIGRATFRRASSIVMVALWTFLGLAFTFNSQPLSVELGLLCFGQSVSSAWTFYQIGWYTLYRG